MRVCICIYMCMCMCMCVCMYAHNYVHTQFIWILVTCLYCRPRAWFVPCLGVCVVNFEQVNAGSVLVILMTRFFLTDNIFD